MKIKRTEPQFFTAGKSYKVKNPRGDFKPTKIHVEYVLDNPTLSAEENTVYNKLIVYRVWLKHKKYWKHYITPFWDFCIYNDWRYEL